MLSHLTLFTTHVNQKQQTIDSDVLGQVRSKPLSVQNEAQREKEKDFLESIWSAAAAAAAAADELTGAATNHPHKIYLAPTSAKMVAYLDTIFLPGKLLLR